MKNCWQAGCPIRWHKKEDGTMVLQQVWIMKEYSDHLGWHGTPVHEWRDVPTDINDPMYWSQDVQR
jgi:hypothetical protein